MKRFLICLTYFLAACGSGKDEKKSDVVSVEALSLEGLEIKTNLTQSDCDFSTGFVSWFVEKHAPDLKVANGNCADSTSDDLPEDFAMMKGKCVNICSVYVFDLVDGVGLEHRYYSLVTRTKEGKRIGTLTNLAYENYWVYLKSGNYDGREYRDNIAKSPSPKLPMISLTFDRAVHQ